MRLISTHCLRFRQHADTFVEWSLGLNAVIAANEGGKSNLAVEAPLWAFFGTAAVRGTKESVRWWGAPARQGAEVTVVFEVGGVIYTVNRTESDATLRDAAGIIHAQGAAAVTEKMPSILGMGRDEFCTTFMCRQKDLARLASMLPTERQAFLRKAMGVESIDVALRSCRKKKAALADERRGMEVGLGERQPYVDDAVAAEDAEFVAGEAAETAATVKSNAREMLSSITAAVAVSTTVEQSHLKLTAQIQEIDHERGRLTTEIVTLDNHIGEHDVETAKQKVTLQGDIDACGMKINSLTAAVAQERELALWDGSALRVTEDELAKAEKALHAAEQERTIALADHRSMLKAYERETANIQGQIAHYAPLAGHPDTPCPTCSRPMGDALDKLVDALRAQLATCDDAALTMRQLVEATAVPNGSEDLATIARDAAVAEVRRLQNLERITQQHAIECCGLENQLADTRQVLTRLEARMKVLATDRAASLASLQERVAMVRVAIESVKVQRTGVSRALDELAFDGAAHARICEEAKAAKASFDATVVNLARAEERHRAATTTLATAHRRLEEYNARAAKLQAVLDAHVLHEKVDARLSEFRTAVAGTIRPEMEELVSGFVNLLTDGRHESVTMTDDFAVIPQEGGVAAEVVSGGTEDVVALAMRLAISQMIAERAGHPLSLLILDEVFAGMDDTRRANVVSLLRRLRSVFAQIIVISHVQETRDACDHAISLRFDESTGRTYVL